MFKDHVQMTVGGRQAMVPAEHAKKVQKKQDLVAQALRLQTGLMDYAGVGHAILQEQLMETMGKIRNLNRRIPPCVKFI
jgi:hypothetical protein